MIFPGVRYVTRCMGAPFCRLLAAATVLAAPWTAPALAAVPGSTAWGGGAMVDAPVGTDFPGLPGDVNIGLRSSADAARVDVSATILYRCTRGGTFQAHLDGKTTIASDGSFTARERERYRLDSGRRVASLLVVTGRIDGARATGTAAITVRTRRDSRRVCGGTATWTAVAAGPIDRTPVATAAGGAVLQGIVSGRRAAPYDVVLRTTDDGRHVSRVNATIPYRCGAIRSEVFYEEGAGLRPDGTFRIENPFELGDRRSVLTGTVVVEGRAVAGGIVGTVRVTSRERSTGSGRLIRRCSSGTQSFAAVP
jgi:hypothetical protein